VGVSLKVIKRLRHGSLKVMEATSFPSFARKNPRVKRLLTPASSRTHGHGGFGLREEGGKGRTRLMPCVFSSN
jgi:hypothetical protein